MPITKQAKRPLTKSDEEILKTESELTRNMYDGFI